MSGLPGGRPEPAAGGPDASSMQPRGRRVFVAIPLPEAARADVAALVTSVRSQADPDVRDVRWVRLDGLHLTLRFIGLVEDHSLEALADAVDAAATSIDGFGISIEGAGAFPTSGRPRVIWLGVRQGSSELERAAAAVEDALAAIGIPRSERPFRSHLSVARADGIRSGADVARRLMDAASGWQTAFTAADLVLFETVAGGGPARYEALHAAPLGGPSGLSGPRRPATAAVLPSEPSAGVRTSVGARRKEQSSGT